MNAAEQSGGPSYLSNKRLIKREGVKKGGRERGERGERGWRGEKNDF